MRKIIYISGRNNEGWTGQSLDIDSDDWNTCQKVAHKWAKQQGWKDCRARDHEFTRGLPFEKPSIPLASKDYLL